MSGYLNGVSGAGPLAASKTRKNVFQSMEESQETVNKMQIAELMEGICFNVQSTKQSYNKLIITVKN